MDILQLYTTKYTRHKDMLQLYTTKYTRHKDMLQLNTTKYTRHKYMLLFYIKNTADKTMLLKQVT